MPPPLPRILHLLDQRDPPAGLAATLALIADTQRREPGIHRTLLLGGAHIRAAARRVGLTHVTLQPSPHALTRAVLALRRAPRELLASADALHCWSVHAAVYAADLGCTTFTPRFGQVGDTPFAAQTLDPARLLECDRDARRSTWNIGPDAKVIALLCDHPDQHSAIPPALIAALTHEASRSTHADAESAKRLVSSSTPHQTSGGASGVHLLLPPNLKHLDDAHRLYHDAGYPTLLLQEPDLDYPWSVLPAADAALLLTPDQPGLAALWARAANLPIVQPTSSNTRPKHLAQQLLTALTPQAAPASAGADPTP